MDRVTKPQKKMLITLLRETKFIEGKKEKEWYWEKIQAALNTIGPKKTIIQWKKCWRDMRLTTRKKLAELKRCQLAGGSPPPGIELNQEDNDIIDIVGTEYFYEEMNGELKPENFMSNFDYVPEHFCDAILTATAATSSGQPHSMQQQKDPNAASQQEQHGNDGEPENVSSANQSDSHGGSFHGSNVSQLHPPHNGEHTPSSSNHNSTLQHSTFPSGLHPHLLRRHHQAAFQRESGFEEKLLQLMQDVFPKKSKKRKRRDPDRLFLLSLYEEIKRVPEEIRLDVKAELIQVLKKYQKKSPVKQEKSHANSTASKQTGSATQEKLPLPQQAQLSHSMYQLQKKYDKAEKETSPQSQVDRVQQLPRDNATLLQSAQQIPHGLFQMQQKKYEETPDKVHHQNEQRKHVDSSHQQQQQHTSHSQPPPPPPNEQHLHHPQMPHGIMFPLAQIRNEQPTGQQHHPHNPHQQQSQHNPHPQHHPSTIFGAPNSSASMSTDRPSMPYESVG